ncbi:MAG: hypothetical protein JSW02_05565 [candidate division WOR-3 bacterium]|nr:MAG: hypothetical protein JSW02_05565 [candidate division WOR-3 bacterium]
MSILVYAALWTLPGISTDSPSTMARTTVYPMFAMEERIECEPWFSRDKFLHFTASAALIGLSHHIYAARLHGDTEQAGIFSVSLTGLIAFSKELYDENQKGTFSWKDLFWDGLGIAVGYFVFIR